MNSVFDLALLAGGLSVFGAQGATNAAAMVCGPYR